MNVPTLSVIPRPFYDAIEAILSGLAYVKTGLNSTATGAGSLFVTVTAGSGVANGVAFSYAGGTLNMGPADSQPRYDLVVIPSGGSSPAKVAGTPGSAPRAPDLPVGDVLLALVYIPGGATDFTSGGFVADYTLPWLALKITTKGDILSFSTVPARRAAGTDGQYLRALAANSDGLEWGTHNSTGDPHTQYALDTDLTTHAGAADPHTGYVLESLLDAKGDLIAASADNTPIRVGPIGANNTVLTADSATSSGMKWAALGAAVVALDSSTVNANFANSTENTLYTFTIPANTFVAGEILRFTVWGRHISTLAGADPPDVTLRFKLGATTILTKIDFSGIGSLGSGTFYWGYRMEISVIVAASSQRGLSWSSDLTTGGSTILHWDPLVATEDLTASKAFALTTQQSTTVAGLVTHFDGCVLERVP